jgi:hypothetical protein
MSHMPQRAFLDLNHRGRTDPRCTPGIRRDSSFAKCAMRERIHTVYQHQLRSRTHVDFKHAHFLDGRPTSYLDSILPGRFGPCQDGVSKYWQSIEVHGLHTRSDPARDRASWACTDILCHGEVTDAWIMATLAHVELIASCLLWFT